MQVIAFGILAIAGLVGFTAILLRWRLGIYMLVVYVPFTGLVVAALQPSPVGNLLRDVLIVIPLYISFFLTRRPADRVSLSLPLLAAAGFFWLVVILQMGFNGLPNLMIGLLGAKVWLMYMPLVLIGGAFVRSHAELQSLLRLLVVMAWVPATVGLMMWMGAITYDYQKAVQFVYGDYAMNATQGFVAFKIGSTVLYRIPGTFQFASQYALFCFFMMFPIFMLVRSDTSRRWRAFGHLTMVVVIAAALTSGARSAFLYVPLIVGMMIVLRTGYRARHGYSTFLILAGVLVASMFVFDETAIMEQVAELTSHYGNSLVIGGMAYAIAHGGLWGLGVGTNTIAARHVMADDPIVRAGYGLVENYYAKAWVEMGLIGFLALAIFLAILVLTGIQAMRQVRDPALRECAAPIVAMILFVLFLSTRGWPLDQDPFAYYMYLFVGILFKLPQLQQATAPVAQRVPFGVPRPMVPAGIRRSSPLRR